MAGGDRKIGRNRNAPSNAAYKAQGRLLRNKKRNKAKEARKQARDAELAPERLYRRKLGAVRRLERRVEMAHQHGKPTGKLYESLNKARLAVDAQEWSLM